MISLARSVTFDSREEVNNNPIKIVRSKKMKKNNRFALIISLSLISTAIFLYQFMSSNPVAFLDSIPGDWRPGRLIKIDLKDFPHHGRIHSLPFHFRINSLGFRGPEVSINSSSKIIMVLGDGYAFGNGLSIGETIPERLDVELKQSSNGVNFVVLNAAMPGYGIGDVIAYMNEKGNKLRPYIVILFITNSDIWETLRPGLIRECGRSTTKSLWKRIIWFFGSEEAYNVHLNIFSRNRKKQKIAGFNLPRDKLSELAFIKFKDSFKEFKSLVNSYGGRLLAVLVATEPPQLEPFLIEESVPFIKTREIIRCHAPGRENYAQELCKNPDLPDWYLEDGHFGPRSATVIAKDIFKWIEKNVSGVGSN